MQEVYKTIGRVAAQDVTVLITGESGTGKELVARAVYQHRPRARAPYRRSTAPPSPRACWRASCSATRRGAFTGADRKRIGKFEQCNGGTLFLDEIGDMAGPCRPRCCAFFRSSNSSASAATRLVRTDVRLIGATHRDLKAWSAEGRSDRISITGRASSPSICPPCATGETTCRCWCNSSCGAVIRAGA